MKDIPNVYSNLLTVSIFLKKIKVFEPNRFSFTKKNLKKNFLNNVRLKSISQSHITLHFKIKIPIAMLHFVHSINFQQHCLNAIADSDNKSSSVFYLISMLNTK